MSKKKITTQQAAKTLMQPAIYCLNFKDVPVDKYMPALKEVFYNPNFVAIAENAMPLASLQNVYVLAQVNCRISLKPSSNATASWQIWCFRH